MNKSPEDLKPDDANPFLSPQETAPALEQPETTIRQSLGKIADSWQACVFLPMIAVVVGLVAAVFGMVVATVIYKIMGGEISEDPTQLLMNMAKYPLLLTLFLIPNQLVFLILAVGVGLLSQVRLSERLAFLKGHDGIWTWPIYILATPAIGFVITYLMGDFIEESPNMKMIADIIHSQSGAGILLLIFLIAVMPGICEEVMFRGFTQNFLARHWGMPAAIIVSSILFAAAHIEPMHVVSVFPIGIWLGLIAWRTGSIIPPILCHFFNNCLSVLAVYFEIETEEFAPMVNTIAGVCGLFFLISIVLFVTRHQREANQVANTNS